MGPYQQFPIPDPWTGTGHINTNLNTQASKTIKKETSLEIFFAKGKSEATEEEPLSKPLEYLEGKKQEQEEQKQLVRASTSTTASALRDSYYSIGEELILPANKDICSEVFFYISQVPLWATAVTRHIEEIEEDIGTQLLPFPPSHLCEARFSAVTATKPELRSRLDIKNTLWVSLAHIIPRWDRIRDQGNNPRALIDLVLW